MSTVDTSDASWIYMASQTIGTEDTVFHAGVWMTPTPVDTLPDPPERGMLVSVLMDPDTQLRWVMLYATQSDMKDYVLHGQGGIAGAPISGVLQN